MIFFIIGFFFSFASYFVVRSTVRDPANHSVTVSYLTVLLAGVLIGASGMQLFG